MEPIQDPTQHHCRVIESEVGESGTAINSTIYQNIIAKASQGSWPEKYEKY